MLFKPTWSHRIVSVTTRKNMMVKTATKNQSKQMKPKTHLPFLCPSVHLHTLKSPLNITSHGFIPKFLRLPGVASAAPVAKTALPAASVLHPAATFAEGHGRAAVGSNPPWVAIHPRRRGRKPGNLEDPAPGWLDGVILT